VLGELIDPERDRSDQPQPHHRSPQRRNIPRSRKQSTLELLCVLAAFCGFAVTRDNEDQR
jgi:hypothetical protein